MSIYNILNKLNSLMPKVEKPADQTKTPVYESVESKGSVLEGVQKVESKLNEKYMGFKKGPAAAADSGRKKSGKAATSKSAAAGKKLSEAEMQEVAAPGQEDWIKKNKERFVKQYGKDKGMSVLYATAWKRSKKDESSQGPAKADIPAAIRKQKGDAPLSVKDVMGANGKLSDRRTLDKLSGEDPGRYHKAFGEGETTKTATGVRHRGSYGTDYQGDADDETSADAPRKRGRPAKGEVRAKKPEPAATKQGRGRPKKAADPQYSGASALQSFMVGNLPKGASKLGKKTVHRMDESVMMVEAGALDHVLNRFKYEVKQFQQSGDLDDDLYKALFDFYGDAGEMPYGVAKARTGDPFQWVSDRLATDLGMEEAFNPMTAQGQQMQAHTFKPGEKAKASNGEVVTVVAVDMAKGMVKVANRFGDETTVPATRLSAMSGQPAAQPAPAAQPTMEDDLNELARLAGLAVSEATKPDFLDLDKDGDKKEPMKKANKDAEVKEAMDPVGKEDSDVDNDGDSDSSDEYLKSRREKIAKNMKEGMGECGADMGQESTMSVNTSMTSNGDKNVTVSASGENAEALLAMLQMAGLGGGQKAQSIIATTPAEVDVAEADAPEYANSPDEEVQTIDTIIHQGNDLNREKQQYADKPKAGDNPMATMEDQDSLNVLSGRLQAAYESIKQIDELSPGTLGSYAKKASADIAQRTGDVERKKGMQTGMNIAKAVTGKDAGKVPSAGRPDSKIAKRTSGLSQAIGKLTK
jgi:hypothetical protein